MNLIDAIKSGRPWREKGGIGTTWWKFDDRVMIIPHPDVKQVHTGPQYRALSWALEQDYEIQEPTVTIKRAQFWDAVADSYPHCCMKDDLHMRQLASKLGLESK